MSEVDEATTFNGKAAGRNHRRETETAMKVPFYKLFSFADSTDKALMIIGSIGAAGIGVFIPLMAILIGDIIDAFGQNQNTKHVVNVVTKVALKFVYLAIASGVASFLQVACWMVTGERQASRMRNLYLKSILRQDVAFFDKEVNSEEVVGRMSGDIFLIQDAMGDKAGQFIELVCTFLGGFVIAFIKGWLLTLVMLSLIAPLVFAGVLMGVFLQKLATQGKSDYAKATVVVEQTIGSIRTVASFTGEKHAITQYNKSLIHAYRSGVKEGLAAGTGLGVAWFVIFCSFALAVWLGSSLILEGHYTGGSVISVVVAVLIGSVSLGRASESMSAFTEGQAAAYQMFETINRKADIDPYDPSGKIVDDIHGDIELRDIYFSYPARPDEQIFRGFSLSITSGTTVALLGQSGSGKSTVISLIERFYDPHAGEVLVDGINIREFQLRWLRQKIGLVSQEPVLFGSSIRDNIGYGKDGATDKEIRTATELANAAKFIDKLPQGMDTLVGEHGIQLSGGQKQIIAIARAILKDPRILLLDEATSALDAESERVVQEALDRIMVSRTTVVVAHRLSTVRNADIIAVIYQGKVVEKGPHSELIKDPEGAYSQLIQIKEMTKDSRQSGKDGDLVRQASKKRPSLRSSSLGSSGRMSSIRLSFSVGGVPIDGDTSTPDSDVEAHPEERPQVWIRRLATLNKPEIPTLILGVLSAIASGVVIPLFSVYLSSVIEMFFKPPHELRSDSRFWALIVVVFAVASLLLSLARAYFFAVAGCKLIERIRSLCFEKVIHMDVGWFDEPENSSGAIGARLSSDAASVYGLVGDSLGLLAETIASVLACLLIAFLANWILAFIFLAIITLLGLNNYFQVKFMPGFSEDAKKKDEANHVANGAIGSIRTVASFCAEEKLMQLYERKSEGSIAAGIKRGLITGVGYGISFALLYCVYPLSFYAGAQLVAHGKTTFADMFRVFIALAIAAADISETSSLAPNASKAKSAATSVFAILDGKSKIIQNNETGMTLKQVKGDIEFQHLSFTYPTRSDVQIFRDFCLTIHHGKTVALVGESGCGKSTVVSLLERFYDPDSGCITIDGVEIKKFQLQWLRQQIGLVSQEPTLFNDTIRANIAYGKGGNATEAEIIAAAEQANAHKFISSLQQGYDTIVGEIGVQLSGGQKQRVAIARAIIKNPRILLLDEATSGLDAESEKVVQDALDQVMVNRTTVVIAHRLSTIKNADVIAVVKNGVIAEKGKHEKLIHLKDGLYASLVALHMSSSSKLPILT
ncbi:hypothetical protein KSS87_015755 [Heliosperma pusillum]|nr:hypothetical protein KSS87_015755 [Heliosperma pusillum]